MSQKPKLLVDFCDYKAAKFAVEHWHYSGVMPAGKTFKIGVWEDDKFIGVVIFSLGACNQLVKPYGLKNTEGCELTRVALYMHISPVTKIVKIAIKLLKFHNPGLRLIVSFADPRQKHYGGIYQGGNWLYFGLSQIGGTKEYYVNGKWIHHRSFGSKFGKAGTKAAKELGIKTRDPQRKFGYLYPLDRAMRRQIEPLAKPYPKRAGG